MRGSYFSILGAFISVVAVPERRIPQLALHDLPLLTLWVATLVLTAGFTIAWHGTARFRRRNPEARFISAGRRSMRLPRR